MLSTETPLWLTFHVHWGGGPKEWFEITSGGYLNLNCQGKALVEAIP